MLSDGKQRSNVANPTIAAIHCGECYHRIYNSNLVAKGLLGEH